MGDRDAGITPAIQSPDLRTNPEVGRTSEERMDIASAEHEEPAEALDSARPSAFQGDSWATSTSSRRLNRRTRMASVGPPPLPSSGYFLHTTNDSLPRSGLPGPDYAAAANLSPGAHPNLGAGSERPVGLSPAVARAQRHASLAASLVQFVAKLPPPSPGSAAAALRSKLGSRLAVGALGSWVAQVAQALRDSGAGGNRDSAESSGGSGLSPGPGGIAPEVGADDTERVGVSAGAGAASRAPPSARLGAAGASEQMEEAEELLVEAMVAAQPQLLAQDSEVLAARLRGLAALLGATPSEALSLASSRPGLLLLDLPTLERRLDGLAAAMGLPDRAAAAAMARSQPAWLYADLPPRQP